MAISPLASVSPSTVSSPAASSRADSSLGDPNDIAALRASAARDPKGAIRAAAKQFEALFMQQLLKSMRASTAASGLLDNAGTQLGTELLDTQLATKMTGLPGGLGDAIARQLERQMSTTAAAPAAAGAAGAPAAAETPVTQRQTDFMRQHAGAARAVEAASGIPAAFMVGQAAHESGWGQREIRRADGTSAHNLFGIKAGAGWSGAVAEITTTEYVGGEAQKVTAKFRAYASYEDSFRDYARLLKESPRYAGAVQAAQAGQVAQAAQAAQGMAGRGATSVAAAAQGFAQSLQRAGYATDPAYADKLGRVINTTLRLQRAVA